MKLMGRKIHVVSNLPKDLETVAEELSQETFPNTYHHISVPPDLDPAAMAKKAYDFIASLWSAGVRAGDTVVFIFGNEDVQLEHICVSCLHRRRQGEVDVFVKKNKTKYFIPYFISAASPLR